MPLKVMNYGRTRLKYLVLVIAVYRVVALTVVVLLPANVVPSSVVWPAITGTLMISLRK